MNYGSGKTIWVEPGKESRVTFRRVGSSLLKWLEECN